MKQFAKLGALSIIVTAVVVCGCGKRQSTKPTNGELEWVGTDVVYDTVANKRDISIIFFMADWCGWCTRMKKEALTDSTVIALLCESYNTCWINPDADSLVVCGDSTITCRQMTSNVFGVRGFPSLAFLRRNGDLIGMAPGYRSPAAMIELLEMVRDGNY